jgi:hypothetical protein
MGVCDVCSKGRAWGVCQKQACRVQSNTFTGEAKHQAPEKDDPLPPTPAPVAMGCPPQFFLGKRGDI